MARRSNKSMRSDRDNRKSKTVNSTWTKKLMQELKKSKRRNKQ